MVTGTLRPVQGNPVKGRGCTCSCDPRKGPASKRHWAHRSTLLQGPESCRAREGGAGRGKPEDLPEPIKMKPAQEQAGPIMKTRELLLIGALCLSMPLAAQPYLQDTIPETVVTATGTTHLLKDAPVQTEVISLQMLQDYA